MALTLTNRSTSSVAKAVAFVPDHLFFVRTVSIDPTAGNIAAQVELALESVSPFPINQLYYGYFLPEASNKALVYAAYRRRFTSEQTAEWPASDSVLPTFAALIPLAPTEPTAIIVTSESYMTLLSWNGSDPLPSIVTQFLPTEAEDEFKGEVRTALLRQANLAAATEISEPPFIFAEDGSNKVEFGPVTLSLTEAQLDTLDVRDKGAMAARMEDRKRSNILWRVFIGILIGLLVCLLGEVALAGTQFWQKSRVARLDRQKPVVEKIAMSSDLANRIDEISTRRLLPIKMLDLAQSKRPATIQFKRADTNGRNGLEIFAVTSNPGDFAAFVQGLRDAPFVERVDTHDTEYKGTNNGATFHISVIFKPDALKGGKS